MVIFITSKVIDIPASYDPMSNAVPLITTSKKNTQKKKNKLKIKQNKFGKIIVLQSLLAQSLQNFNFCALMTRFECVDCDELPLLAVHS